MRLARLARVDRHHQDRGSGLLGTTVGFLVFLVLLLAAIQTLVHLYATSVITSAALDAAAVVAPAVGNIV